MIEVEEASVEQVLHLTSEVISWVWVGEPDSRQVCALHLGRECILGGRQDITARPDLYIFGVATCATLWMN